MKQFFGAFFGSIIGIVIATVVAILIVVGIVKSSFDAVVNRDDEAALSARNSPVLRLVLQGDLSDREPLNPFEGFGDAFGDDAAMGLNTLLHNLKAAKSDDRVKGIYLVCKNLNTGFASLKELRDALADFKKSGKFIYAYSEDFGQREYFVASVASKIYLNPQGNFDWRGLNMSLLFFKQAFEKLNVEMQVFRHGKFKSAVEPFVADKMSEANRYQSEIFLNSIWGTLLADIARDRKLGTEELNALANQLSIQYPEDAVGKFVDATAYEDEVVAALKKKLGMKESDKLKLTDLGKYRPKTKSEAKTPAGKLAVIYASGSISSGEGNDEEIGSERLVKAIRDARLDSKIKGIVLRVNSPGGSALASEVILREMQLARKAKPTVVSMGDMAASGGYYISCNAHRIFAQPNTITGSIGVFGLIPNVQKALQQKLGITVDTVNTNRYSDLGTGLRAVTDKEYAYIQNSVERVYDVFTKRVAEGRGIQQAQVDSIGQGRVWTGADALRIGLVDELGGLDAALAWVAKKAGVSDYKTVELPKQKNPFDELLGKKESEMESRLLKQNMGGLYTYFKQLRQLTQLEGVQMRLPFEIVAR